MTISMTGFSRAEKTLGPAHLVWEIRSVNHRYLDVNMRLPDDLRQFESAYRTSISEKLNRGRIDATLKLDRSGETVAPVINLETAGAVVDMYQRLREQFPGFKDPGYPDIVRWPGVIQENALEAAALNQAAGEALGQALADLVDNRRKEGARLGEMIADRLDACRKEVRQLSERLPDLQARTREKWQTRITEVHTDADGDRIAQEIALILTKADVAEELDRLDTHFDEVEALLKARKPVGRNLDFLMQELNREANTLGSKSIDEAMTSASIELKVLVEQMREQVQNIE